MKPIVSIPLESANLPPLHRFRRPLWAYEHLGWEVLHEHLFGQTPELLDKLESRGDAPISAKELAALIKEVGVTRAVRNKMNDLLCGQSAGDLADAYRVWEDHVFQAYLAREQDNEQRKLGKSN